MDMAGAKQWSSTSSPSSSHPKRPAGRTKFKETRHPVYRGVRRRGSAGRWVCEPGCASPASAASGSGSARTSPRSRPRARTTPDAAMLALLGSRSASSVACLNFPDSAWLLAVPSALANLADVRRAALAAVADFQRREAVNCAATVPVDEVDNSSASATSPPFANEVFDGVPEAALGSDMIDFELDMSGEMDLGLYYADLAEGMLLEPPLPEFTEVCWDGGADYAALWNYC